MLRVASDGVAPSTPGTITHSLVPPATLGATVPVKVAWGASTDADSGVARYLVERSDDGGGFFGVTTAGTSITQPLLVGHLYQYRVTAIDAVGNASAVRTGGAFRSLDAASRSNANSSLQLGEHFQFDGTRGRTLGRHLADLAFAELGGGSPRRIEIPGLQIAPVEAAADGSDE